MTCWNCGGRKSWFSAECGRCGARDPGYRSSIAFWAAVAALGLLFVAIALG